MSLKIPLKDGNVKIDFSEYEYLVEFGIIYTGDELINIQKNLTSTAISITKSVAGIMKINKYEIPSDTKIYLESTLSKVSECVFTLDVISKMCLYMYSFHEYIDKEDVITLLHYDYNNLIEDDAKTETKSIIKALIICMKQAYADPRYTDKIKNDIKKFNNLTKEYIRILTDTYINNGHLYISLMKIK